MIKMLNLSIYDMADYYATNDSIYEVHGTGDMEVRKSVASQEVTENSMNFYFLFSYFL